jgi:hypothetical protein
MEVKVNAHPPVTCGIDWAEHHVRHEASVRR